MFSLSYGESSDSPYERENIVGRFEGTTVVVTGGAGGQGASHVRAYHREGASVVVAGIAEDRSRALVEELGDRALFA